MQIPCPGCGKQLPLSDELMGKKIRCGGCLRVVEIPLTTAQHEQAADASATVATAPGRQIPEPTAAAAPPAGNTPTMLVDCPCGNRSCWPTSSSGSEVRCPGCGRLMRIPDPPAPGKTPSLFSGTLPRAVTALPQSHASKSPVNSPVTVHPHRRQPRQQPTNNTPVIITAVSCLFGLALIIVSAIVIDNLGEDPETAAEANATAETVDEPDSLLAAKRVGLQEGYSLVLPVGCAPVSREVTDKGYVVYRFRSEQGLRLTVAMIPQPRNQRAAPLPRQISEASVRGVSELTFADEADVSPTYHAVDRLRAALFRYYETRTYANRLFFKYVMVVLDKERKLVLHFDGIHGDVDNPSPPEHWRESLLTLRRESDLQRADVKWAFAPTPGKSEAEGDSAAAKFGGELILLDAGYAVEVPQDFQPIERNEYRGGDIRYQFRSPTGTLKIRVKPSQQSNRRSIPPVVLEDPPGNLTGAIVEVGGRYYFNAENVESVLLDGMTSCLCRVDHPLDAPPGRKLRGYFLIAMDEGQEVHLELTGEMQGPVPEAWRKCAISLRHADVTAAQMPAAFRSP